MSSGTNTLITDGFKNFCNNKNSNKVLGKNLLILNTAEFQFTDLKPHSIFVIEKGNSINLKVTDFDYKCTFEGTKCPKIRYGSIYFVSPEVIEQSHNDEWLVWNVGAILYLLLSGKQIVEEYGFKKYQDKLKENSQVNFELSEFKSINQDIIDLLRKMLDSDQFLRSSLVDSNHHKVLLNSKCLEGEKILQNTGILKKRLKIFQGEMIMYSNIWGIIYTQVVWQKKHKKKVEK